MGQADENQDLTPLIRRLGAGEEELSPEVFRRIYGELRAIAGHQMASERSDHTLQPTALVNEAYLRLLGGTPMTWNDRAHFYRAAAQAMRRILIDHARGKGRQKRGGGACLLPLDVMELTSRESALDILAVDEAVCRLEEWDARMAEIVKLRFFAGFTTSEAAQALEITTRSAERYWAFARAWLLDELKSREADSN